MDNFEEGLVHQFLSTVTEPFTLGGLLYYMHRTSEGGASAQMAVQLDYMLSAGHYAFYIEGENLDKKWISRRGYFEPARFVIKPSRLELINGILIPGHRCIPFANTALLPGDYHFFWQGSEIPETTSEGTPDEIYPFFSLFGQEYVPQFLVHDNEENRENFGGNPYDEPDLVSVKSFDMRAIYRETGFVPGDCFVVRTINWEEACFSLEKVSKDAWDDEDIDEWIQAAEKGFLESFKKIGPGKNLDQQIAHAYWYGGARMRELPSCPLEDFIYERSNRIELTPYGIESRFWYAGRELPDRSELDTPKQLFFSPLEEILVRNGIPMTERAVHAYIVDSLFQGEDNTLELYKRLVPTAIQLEKTDEEFLKKFLTYNYRGYKKVYNAMLDRNTGPLRSRMVEINSAVIELAAKLRKSTINGTELPSQTYIRLSQIQSHAINMLENNLRLGDMDDIELESAGNSLTSMVEEYNDIKDEIDDSIAAFRRNAFSIVRPKDDTRMRWRTLQLSIGGTDVWRRITVPETLSLEKLHHLIYTVFNWTDDAACQFINPGNEQKNEFYADETIADLTAEGLMEIWYEFGDYWTIKVLIQGYHLQVSDDEQITCIGGEKASPPDSFQGPVEYRRYLKKRGWLSENKDGFDPEEMDLEECNKRIAALSLALT
ncbi:MAG: plasmid pRiA4b ORF-3 family protein [Spirochaetaceae bacterium]|nr:plasmid pRiA4b ORF-3 family protein [Spirochaetaceae bacterium]